MILDARTRFIIEMYTEFVAGDSAMQREAETGRATRSDFLGLGKVWILSRAHLAIDVSAADFEGDGLDLDDVKGYFGLNCEVLDHDFFCIRDWCYSGSGQGGEEAAGDDCGAHLG